MPLRLPTPTSVLLPASPADLVAALHTLAQDPPRQGYVHLEQRDRDTLVFFHQGKPYQAGSYDGERPSPMPLPQLLSATVGVLRARVVPTDLPLFLCAAVMFRKAPAAHVPAALVDGETVLKNIRVLGKDAVVVIQRGDARSLCFCRGGEPVALYPATGEVFAEEGSIGDRIVEYVYACGGGVTLDLYDDIQLPPAADAGQPLSLYLAPPRTPLPVTGQDTPALVVRLGERVVFRFPVVKDEIVIGRGDDVDLVLDNLSVSRRHARLKRDGRALVLTDLGSENGLVVHKPTPQKQSVVTLSPGDEVGVGKYTLVFSHYGARSAGEQQVSEPPRPRPQTANMETMALPRAGRGVVLEHNGEAHRVVGALFVIGKGVTANVNIRGFWVSDVHLVLARDADGWRVTRTGRFRALTVNGQKTAQSRLKDGDVLVCAGHRFVFRDPT